MSTQKLRELISEISTLELPFTLDLSEIKRKIVQSEIKEYSPLFIEDKWKVEELYNNEEKKQRVIEFLGRYNKEYFKKFKLLKIGIEIKKDSIKFPFACGVWSDEFFDVEYNLREIFPFLEWKYPKESTIEHEGKKILIKCYKNKTVEFKGDIQEIVEFCSMVTTREGREVLRAEERAIMDEWKNILNS